MKANTSISILILISLLFVFQTACNSTSQVTTRSKDLLRDTPAATMDELLRRQPNLIVQGSGQNISLQIRGDRSITSSNEPLIIIDGIRMGSGYNRIAHINPADVARINIVRDPANLASYGLGASNGVIDIRLKKGADD